MTTRQLFYWPMQLVYNFKQLCTFVGLKEKRRHSVWVQGYLQSRNYGIDACGMSTQMEFNT